MRVKEILDGLLSSEGEADKASAPLRLQKCSPPPPLAPCTGCTPPYLREFLVLTVIRGPVSLRGRETSAHTEHRCAAVAVRSRGCRKSCVPRTRR